MSPTVRGVHLVGSIPLRNTSEVFHTISKALPHHLRRVPDGETGERWYFARWQAPKIGEWPLVLNPLIRGFLKLSDPEPPTYTESEKLETLRDMEEKLQVGYDIAALESWEVFRKLKAEGVIGRNVRFLVALPSPVTITALYVRRGFQVEFEGVYGRVLLKALERIQEGIPPEELSVQWDCPFEFGMIDGAEFPGRDTEKWWEESMSEGVVRRLVRVRESVKEDVELGVHLCYGESCVPSMPPFVGLTTDRRSARKAFHPTKEHGDFGQRCKRSARPLQAASRLHSSASTKGPYGRRIL